jgi:hypothetical protein
MSIST